MKQLKTLLLSTLMSFTINASAAFGIGDIVSDPGSYGYYVDQLKSMAQQLEKFNELNAKTDEILSDSQEVFDFSQKIQGKFKNELDIYNNYRSTLDKLQRKKLDFDRKFDPKDLREVIDTNLDGIYVDPDDPLFNTERLQKSRNFERQRLLKQSLIKSEEKLIEVGQSYELLAQYAQQAKNTKSQKAAADLQNTILLEILKSVNNLVEILSTQGQAEMAIKYTHYNKQQHEEHVQGQKNRYPNGYKALGETWVNRDAYREFGGKCRAYHRIHGHSDTTIDGSDCAGKYTRLRSEKLKKLGI